MLKFNIYLPSLHEKQFTTVAQKCYSISNSSRRFQLHPRLCKVHRANFSFTVVMQFHFHSMQFQFHRQGGLFKFYSHLKFNFSFTTDHGTFNFGFAHDNFQTVIMINKHKLAIRKNNVSVTLTPFSSSNAKKDKLSQNSLRIDTFHNFTCNVVQIVLLESSLTGH